MKLLLSSPRRKATFVSCQHDERLLNLLINDQETLEMVAHATLNSWSPRRLGNRLVRGQDVSLWKHQQLLILSFSHSAVWFSGIQNQLFHTSDHFGLRRDLLV